MFSYCSLILIILYQIGSSISQNDQNFNNFRSCLLQGGFRSNDIVRRSSSSSAYRNLNYQFRVNPRYINPVAYLQPSRERDVVTAVTCGRRNNIRITARGGGHQYGKLAWGDENSVVIDMQRLNRVSLLSDSRASVGAGTILGNMGWKLYNAGKVFTPVGLCPMVGVVGLSTMGGHGYFTRMYGLTTDHILEVKIVSATGSLLTVNSQSNSDLYWALRGGGAASFGIVTNVVLRTRPVPSSIFEAIIQYTLRSFPEVYDAWQRFLIDGPRSLTPNFRVRRGNLELHFFDGTGSSNAFDRIIRNFPPPRNRTTRTYDYPNFIFYAAKTFGGSMKPEVVFNKPSDLENLRPLSSQTDHIKTKSYYVPKVLSKEEINRMFELFKSQPEAVRCRFEAYGGAVNDVRASDTAFFHRSSIGYNSRGTVDYTQIKDAATNRTAKRWLDRFYDLGRTIFKSRETYQNYIDLDLPDYLRRYYGRNLERLVQIKRKYDPDNYFRNAQSIPTRLRGTSSWDDDNDTANNSTSEGNPDSEEDQISDAANQVDLDIIPDSDNSPDPD